MTATILIQVVAIVVGFLACLTDVRSRRIPNVLTFAAAATGVLAHVWLEGWAGLQVSVLGWFVGVALFLPLFLLRGMGAGDVKLLGALGAWLGPWNALWLAAFATVAGGVMAVIVALAHGYLRTALRNTGGLLRFWVLVGPRPLPALTLERSEAPRLAYAIPIFVGTVVTVWLR